jgi:hypothetical protein
MSGFFIIAAFVLNVPVWFYCAAQFFNRTDGWQRRVFRSCVLMAVILGTGALGAIITQGV